MKRILFFGSAVTLAAAAFYFFSLPYNTGYYELAGESQFLKHSAPPQDWAPKSSGTLEEKLPVSWPAKYQGKQDFNPWAFFRNARILCDHYIATKNPDTLSIMSELLDRLLTYTEVIDGARYVLYRFPHSYRRQIVPAPWTSAYGSGAALIGLSAMESCAEVPNAMKVAHEIFAGLAKTIDPKKVRPKFWVSFIDEERFLWFEEMPMPGVEQPRILNGHIRAIMGLHAYWVLTQNPIAENLLQGGIYTIEKNAPRYRQAGQINRYDLLEPPKADYGPERTVAQQDYLFQITGHSDFATFRQQFQSDIDAYKASEKSVTN